MALATATVAAITAVASTAATVGTVVGAVGLGLTLIGAVTKNKDLLKVGKIAGIAGGAMALGAFAASGVASAFSASGALAGQTASSTTQTTAQTIADSSIDQAAATLSGKAAAGANASANVAGSPAMGATEVLADGATGAGNIASGVKAAGGVGSTVLNNNTLQDSSQLAHLNEPNSMWMHDNRGQLAGLNLPGNNNVAPPGTGPDNPIIASQYGSAIGPDVSIGNDHLQFPGSQSGGTITGQPSQPNLQQPQGIINQSPAPAGVQQYQGAAGPPEAGFMDKVKGWFQSSPDSGSFFSKMSPGEKAFLLSGAVQGVGGLVGGIYGGMSQAEQNKLQRWVAEEQFKNNRFAPAVQFRGQPGRGVINARG